MVQSMVQWYNLHLALSIKIIKNIYVQLYIIYMYTSLKKFPKDCIWISRKYFIIQLCSHQYKGVHAIVQVEDSRANIGHQVSSRIRSSLHSSTTRKFLIIYLYNTANFVNIEIHQNHQNLYKLHIIKLKVCAYCFK